MPTILTHAAVPLAIGIALGSRRIPKRLLLAGVACSMLPDMDVLAFRFGIAYADAFGHRGASHSLVAALLVGLLAALFASRLRAPPATVFLFTGASTFSHGLLDTLTTGGLGAALWWPFSAERIFAPWRVVRVSPLSAHQFFSERGVAVLWSELMWIWLPALSIASLLLLVRRAGDRPRRGR